MLTAIIPDEYLMKSEEHCLVCNKKLLTGIYITLNDQNHMETKRYCYSCQINTFGLDFVLHAKKNAHECFYCNFNLLKETLFENRKYYIFTDMSDAKQIVFCKQCFEENSPK